MSDDEVNVKPMNIATLDYFLDWLERNRDLPREEMRLSLMHSFGPPPMGSLNYFQSDRERYLRREVADKFLRGEEVDKEELREAVYYLCTYLSQAGDALAAEQRRRIERRERNIDFLRPRRRSGPVA